MVGSFIVVIHVELMQNNALIYSYRVQIHPNRLPYFISILYSAEIGK